MQAPDYVLQAFSQADLSVISETLDRAVEAALTWVTDGLDTAMNKYNGTIS
jgi:PTH1 family peptidyl-tRNA hydrolase